MKHVKLNYPHIFISAKVFFIRKQSSIRRLPANWQLCVTTYSTSGVGVRVYGWIILASAKHRVCTLFIVISFQNK